MKAMSLCVADMERKMQLRFKRRTNFKQIDTQKNFHMLKETDLRVPEWEIVLSTLLTNVLEIGSSCYESVCLIVRRKVL